MRGVRKLAAVCIGFATAIFVAHYLLKLNMLLPAASICFAAGVLGFALKGNARKRVMLALFAAGVGFLGYKYCAETRLAPWEALADSELTVNAVVTEYTEVRDGYNVLYVRFADEALPKTDGVLYDYSDSTAGLRPGDRIEVSVKLKSARQRYNERTDVNISKGLYAVGTVKGECILLGHADQDFIYFPKHIGYALKDKIREVFPEDAAPFMLALLTGDKTEYYGDGKLSTAMSTAGLAHVVAVSGMHVAFLVGFLMTVMGRNRRSALLCIALVWIFVLMVGAPPSSVRAAIMQTMLLSAYLLRREFDNLTVLSFALALILAFNPFACGSISLQLSFAAMSGIMLLTQPVFDLVAGEKPYSRGVLGRIKMYLAGALASSLAASVFTVPLIALHFGYVSVLAPLANILCLWCISLLFCGGYIVCALEFAISAVAGLLGELLSYPVRYIELVVTWISNVPYSALYVENKLTIVWLAVTYAVFVLYFLLKRKRKLTMLVPTAATVLSFAALVLITRSAMLRDAGTFTVLDVGNGQCICVTKGENAVVIDCGSSGVADNPGAMASGYLHASGRSRIDAIVITHLHSDHTGGVCRLINSTDVGVIYLPQDAEEENGILEDILLSAEENSVRVEFIDCDRELSCGDIDLSLYILEENVGALVAKTDINGYTMLVTGDAESKAELELADRVRLDDIEILMVGHHGSKYSSCDAFLQAVNPYFAVISVGSNSYGHPTEETLERLGDTDAVVYRTDTDGRIVLRTE